MMGSPFVVNIKYNGCDVYIGRGSEWGNPFTVGRYGREHALEMYEMFIKAHPELIAKAKRELKGKVLGCHCAPKACHGDLLAEIAND